MMMISKLLMQNCKKVTFRAGTQHITYQNECRRKYTSLTKAQFLSGIDFWVGEGKYMLFCFKYELLRGFKENKQLTKNSQTQDLLISTAQIKTLSITVK